MKLFFTSLSLTFFLIAGYANHAKAQDAAQANTPRTLNITATSEVMLPADLIQFNITINAEAEAPQQAYEKHQELEQALVSLLKQYSIKEEDIQFQPISISENRDRREEGMVTFYRTRQVVNLTFSDFGKYEEIQVALIENGFDEFNGRFLTTQKEEGMDKALQKAIQKARDTAKLMAEAAKVELGGVLHLSYNKDVVRPYATPRRSMAAQKSEGLMQYKQTVKVRATVSVEYFIDS